MSAQLQVCEDIVHLWQDRGLWTGEGSAEMKVVEISDGFQYVLVKIETVGRAVE